MSTFRPIDCWLNRFAPVPFLSPFPLPLSSPLSSPFLSTAGVQDDWDTFYDCLISIGRDSRSISLSLLFIVLKKFDPGTNGRLTLAIDDSPTARYGKHVEGAGDCIGLASCNLGNRCNRVIPNPRQVVPLPVGHELNAKLPRARSTSNHLTFQVGR